jgi:UPF0755 protein
MRRTVTPCGNEGLMAVDEKRPTSEAAAADQNRAPGPEVSAPIGRAEAPSRAAPRSARARLEPERMPQPARHSKRARHPLVIAGNAIFTGIIILAGIAGLTIAYGRQRLDAPGPLAQEKIVNIPRGAGFKEISDLLMREGVIDSPYVFMGTVLTLKTRDSLKSGEYAFAKEMTMRDVIDTMVENRVVQHPISIPEGLTSEQIITRLLENDVLTGTLREVPREGTLLPETYKVPRGTTRERVVQLMQQAQQRVVKEAWERRSPDLPLKSPEQLVTLASIVERETGRNDERTRVAAVFSNRLKQKMKLQSDPTIIYGLVGGKGTLGRPISRGDIDQPTPYNTYTIEGLPPGPIANPGRASIEATANPSRTRELFFVADGSGGHTFSETLDQHNRAVARLRQLEQQQREGTKPEQTVTGAAAAPAPEAGASPPADTVAPAVPPTRRGAPRDQRQQNQNRTRSSGAPANRQQ